MKYRITKYNPEHRSENGAYSRADWTSISDIGIVYENKIFTKKEYLSAEKAYLNAIAIIFENFNSKGVVVKNLEKAFSYNEIEKIIVDISNTEVEETFKSIENDAILNLEKTKLISILILRETLWCELLDVDGKFKITFGYDYYMYCDCDSISDEIIKKIEKENLYVD